MLCAVRMRRRVPDHGELGRQPDWRSSRLADASPSHQDEHPVLAGALPAAHRKQRPPMESHAYPSRSMTETYCRSALTSTAAPFVVSQGKVQRTIENGSQIVAQVGRLGAMDERIERVAKLLHEAGETHHLVYRIVDGDDPDWASWYADWLGNLSELPEILGVAPVRGELVWLLVKLDKEYTKAGPSTPWPRWMPSGCSNISRRRRPGRRRPHDVSRPKGQRTPTAGVVRILDRTVSLGNSPRHLGVTFAPSGVVSTEQWPCSPAGTSLVDRAGESAPAPSAFRPSGCFTPSLHDRGPASALGHGAGTSERTIMCSYESWCAWKDAGRSDRW